MRIDLSTTFDMLDASANGYRVKMFQGNGNNPFVQQRSHWKSIKSPPACRGASPLSTGAGYNRPGWQSAGTIHARLATRARRV